MSVNCRFALDEERYVIDAVNVANSGKVQCHEGAPEDDKYLRERLLMDRLSEMINKLIINLRPKHKLPFGEEYEPNEGSDSITEAVLNAIRASHLNTFDPTMSIQHKFDGNLRRQKKMTQCFTSLSLFRDDVECLLRDLYGDVDTEALDSIIWAVFVIVEEFTKYVRPDLWKEHHDAVNLDYIVEIDVSEGLGISYSDFRLGMIAKHDLMLRVCEVRENPSAFSLYTGEFAAKFGEKWDYSIEAAAEAMAAAKDPSLRIL
jgi:hypothetical protein